MDIRQADAALRTGQTATAIACFRRALWNDPTMASVWYNLGYALRLDRQFNESLDAYHQALANGISHPEEVHLNRAAIFSEQLSAHDEALTELNKALLLNPGFFAGWLNLGMLHEDMGQIIVARDAYRNVLRIAPQNGRAISRLAAINQFEDRAADMVHPLEAALRLPHLPFEDAIDIGFGLANIYDAIGRHEKAFALAMSANQAQHQKLPEQLRYNPAEHERLVDALCSMRLPPPLPSNDTSITVPIFICGLFRSGSTLAEQLLARHSGTVSGGEYDFIPEIVRNSLKPFPRSLAEARQSELEGLRYDYLSRLTATGYTFGPVSDKRCDNFLYVGLIKSLFPTAKIVHSYRSPLDNAISMFFQHFADSINYSMDLGHLGHWLAQYRKLMKHWRALYGVDIHDFCYDTAVLDVEPAVRAMVEHCGLKWNNGTGPTNSIVKTASAWQVRQPLHQRSSGRWRNYAQQLEAVMQAAGIDEQGMWLDF